METIDMDKSFVHLKNDGSVFASTKRFMESNYTVSFFHFTEYRQSHPDYWELHPNGDELIFVLEGKIQVEYIPPSDLKLSSNSSNEIVRKTINKGQTIIRGLKSVTYKAHDELVEDLARFPVILNYLNSSSNWKLHDKSPRHKVSLRHSNSLCRKRIRFPCVFPLISTTPKKISPNFLRTRRRY